MVFADTCLDKISRITQNPDIWHVGKRLKGLILKQLHDVGLYSIPEASLLRNWDSGASLYLRPGELWTRRLWFLGYFEYNEDYFVRSYVRPGMTVLDVGANIGLISIIAGLRVRPAGSVHSFEAIPSTYEYLKKNISVNGLDGIVIANQLAISNKSGEVVSFDYCEQHSHLNRMSAGGPEKQKDWHSAREQATTVTLDDYVIEKNISSVDFIKIDVEGAELLALAGARQTIEKHHPTVLCEINQATLQRLGGSSTELWNVWTSYGYRFFEYNHRRHALTPQTAAPKEGAPTYVGTTDPEALAVHIGARIL